MKPTSGVTTALISCSLTVMLLLASSSTLAQTVVVPSGSVWKYLDDGSNQGTAWRQSGFNDASWSSGAAQLGYGDGDEATVVGFGPDPNNKYVTTYFRCLFDVPDPSAYDGLLLRLLRDDGAVVYLNGSEVCRSNMPAGTIGHLTLASGAVSGAGEYSFYDYYVDPALLEPGSNTLAVEVHQSGVASSDLSFDLEMVSAGSFRKAPYLTFAGDASRMRVNWQLHTTRASEISWGLDTLYSLGSAVTSEYGDDHQHSCTLTGLVPGTIHAYRVVAGQDTLSGSFRSAPGPGAGGLKFFAYGDSRTYPLDHDQVAGAMVSAAEADPGFQTFVVTVGDLVSNGDVEDYWDEELFNPDYPGITSMLARLPYQVAMGNHEESGVLFTKYFPFPFAGGRYWSFDYGPAHFAMVDQYTDYGPGSAQLAWLEDDLASTDRPWRFVCLHEPGWSAGGNHENDSIVQNYYQPLCEEYGVAVVFGGHNHYYARCQVNGIEHVTTGGGGAPLYAPDTTYPYVVTAEKVLHYCKVEIDQNVLSFEALTPDGRTIDQFTLVRTPIGTGEDDGAERPGGASGGEAGLRITYPNPFNASVRVSFSLEHPTEVVVGVFSVDGRLVRTLAAETLGRGEHGLTWDGLDDGGRQAASGVYVCKLEVGGRSEAATVVLLR